MRNMRALASSLCWILTFHWILVSPGPPVHASNLQRNRWDGKDWTRSIVKGKPLATPRPQRNASFLTTGILFRGKRDNEEEEVFGITRHEKHRRRRRCRNRVTCPRGGVFLVRTLNETNKDRPTMVESKEKPTGLIDRSQESYDESRWEDYDVIDTIDEERGSSGPAMDEDLGNSYDGPFVSGVDELAKEPAESRIMAPPIYSTPHDQIAIHESLSVLLSKLFQSLRNATATENPDIFGELNFVNGTSEDPCQRWLNSKDKLQRVFSGGLASLPACPCQYPSDIFYDDKIWDQRQQRYFRWRDVSGKAERLDVYKPGAAYCVRSLLAQGSGSAAAQHCCYDRSRKLLTRGSGAGTPNFVSPEISPVLHERIDVLPWRLCKGDFSRYNAVRPPNNDNNCEANPDDEEYLRQIDETRYY